MIAAEFLPGASGTSGIGTSRQGVPMYSWVVPVLPYIDNQELFNQWTMYFQNTCLGYLSPFQANTSQATNLQIGNTTIGVLVCPDDQTAVVNQGNLSYVVNSGYTLIPTYPAGWLPSNVDGGATLGPVCIWAPPIHGVCRGGERDAEAGGDVSPIDVRAVERRGPDSLELADDDGGDHRRGEQHDLDGGEHAHWL